jgi:hypothetical protein
MNPILMAILKAVMKNAQHASKGEKSTAQVNLLDMLTQQRDTGGGQIVNTQSTGPALAAPNDYYLSQEARNMGTNNALQDAFANNQAQPTQPIQPVQSVYQQPQPMVNSQIPQSIIDMQKPQQQSPNQTSPGFFAGTSGKAGRDTAYYGGRFIPDIVRTRLGVPTAGEEASRQAMLNMRSQSGQLQPVIDPNTGQIAYYRPAKSVFQPPSLEEKGQAEINVAKEKAKIPTADMKNLLLQTKGQIANLETLRQEARTIKGGWGGIGNIITAEATRGKSEGATMRYMRKIPAYSAGMYRSLTGDNRLSDADAAARAKPLLWDPTVDDSLKEPMFNDLELAFKARERLLEKGMYTVDEKTNQPVLDLNQIINEKDQMKRDALEILKRRGKING